MLRKAKIVGLSRTLGAKIGENKAQRNFKTNFRCILTNQDELQIEKFVIAPALNS